MSILFIMNTLKKRKKHSYLLLELLIAISILALFWGPMLRAPFSYLVKQKEEITSLYLRLEGEKSLIELEENLRTGQIPWSKIIQSQKERVLIKNSSNLFFPDKNFPKVESSIFLSKSSLKKMETGTWIGKVQATVEFSDFSNKKVLHTVKSVFFVSKKKMEVPLTSPPFSDVKDSICRGNKK
ncbi:MAG: hypothetical protein JSS09_06675 [Verrucomicrobia bacterium]|nr:hypothetical protein [Verrucomicrobiota bacterium]